MVGTKYRGVMPCPSSKGADIVNPGTRDDNGRRESDFAGARRASPDSGRQIEIPSVGVTDREISGMLGLDHSVPDPVDRGELTIGTHVRATGYRQ